MKENPDWRNSHPLSERLTSLVIVDAQLRAPLKPLKTIVFLCTEGFKGPFIWAPMMPSDASLSDNCVSDRCCFSKQALKNSMQLWNALGGVFSFSKKYKRVENIHRKSKQIDTFPAVFNDQLYTGSSKKMVGKLNCYNFCSMPDRKFYPSSF